MKQLSIRWRIAGISIATIFTIATCEKASIGEKSPQTVAASSNTLSTTVSTLSSTSASVWADVAIVENYLATLGKLSPSNLPTGNTAAKEATGRIGEWIDAHHCEN